MVRSELFSFAVGLERSLAYAERLQRDPSFAMRAQNAQPALGLGLGSACERHRGGCDTQHNRRIWGERRLSVHCDTSSCARWLALGV